MECITPVLENWLKDVKSPKSTINKTLEVSKELSREFQIFQMLWIGKYSLQMIAEGKLNLSELGGRNFQIEELKLKNLRNNMIILFLGIVIVFFIVF